jgi:mannosyltransferase OCH1-like enzyme
MKEVLDTAIKLDLSEYDSIPKVIHVSWKTKNILNNKSPIILNGLVNLKKLNPDYKLEISDDNDVEIYLKSKLKKWDYLKIKNKKIVEKIDLWRLFKIYNEGGIYVDIDRYCNISFENIIKNETKCILPTHGDIDFSQDLMISCRKNPIFKKAIEYNLASRFLINPRGVFHLGPPIYMKAVTECVFDIRIKRKPGSEVMDNLRISLQNSKHFQTYKETLPNDSLIFNYNKETFQNGNGLGKEEFYKSQNITTWSSGYDKNTIVLLIIFGIVILCLIIKSVANNL